MMNIDGKIVVDQLGRHLAKLMDYGKYIRVKRLPACTLGDYFVILNWLSEWGYNAI